MSVSYCLALLAILIASVGQILLKYGITQYQNTVGEVHIQLKTIVQLSLSPFVLSGLALYFFSAFVWILTLSRFQLSEAYPLLGLSYVIILVISHFFLGEPITTTKICGTALVILGIMLIASKGG